MNTNGPWGMIIKGGMDNENENAWAQGLSFQTHAPDPTQHQSHVHVYAAKEFHPRHVNGAPTNRNSIQPSFSPFEISGQTKKIHLRHKNYDSTHFDFTLTTMNLNERSKARFLPPLRIKNKLNLYGNKIKTNSEQKLQELIGFTFRYGGSR